MMVPRPMYPLPAPLRGPAAILAAGALLGLSACLSLPASMEGAPAGEGWLALPLRAWIAEGDVRANAVAACLGEACGGEVVIGLFTAEGAEAAALSAVLRDPAKLRRGIEASDAADTDRRRRSVRTLVEILPLTEPGFDGFAVALSRADDARAPAHGAVLARADGARLRFVLAIGPNAARVRAAAAAAARTQLGRRAA